MSTPIFTIITPPDAFITYEELGPQTRTDLTFEDNSTISPMIATAVEYVEHKSGRALLDQTLEMRFDKWPNSKGFELMRSPVQSISSIKYYDKDNVEHTVSSNVYFLENTIPARILLNFNQVWPADELRPGYPIVIEYVAGYGSTIDNVPARYVQAVLLLAAHLYENREATVISDGTVTVNTLPYGLNSLLRTGQGNV